MTSEKIEVGDYTYYDDPDEPTAFEQRNVLYAYGPERLVIGRYCALAAGVRFVMPGANHASWDPRRSRSGSSAATGPRRRWTWSCRRRAAATPSSATTCGSATEALVMPGVTIGDGAIVAAGSVVVGDVRPYAVVGGNPARELRRRYDDADVERLLRAAWWDWPVELVTEHARTIMAGTPAELERIATSST